MEKDAEKKEGRLKGGRDLKGGIGNGKGSGIHLPPTEAELGKAKRPSKEGL